MTIREVGTLCLAPVVLMGYLASTDFHFKETKHKTTIDNAAIVSVQTCEKGWGLEAKAATNGLYGAGIQYGFKFEPTTDTSVTFIPKFGVSYVDHPVVELPQRTQFGLGGQVLFGYKDMRLGVELWHMSDGKALGLNVSDRPNIGVNMIAIQTGWVF
jgi:hypothetical protein